MYLSRLILNSRSRQIRSELADIYEMHRTLMRAFQGKSIEKERILFRVDLHPRSGIPTLMVQSQTAPDWSFLHNLKHDYLLAEADLPEQMENPAVKTFDLTLKTDQVLKFRLMAIPSKRFSRNADEKARKRVGILKEEDQIVWLRRKFAEGGAELLEVNGTKSQPFNGKLYRDKTRHELRFFSVLFEGYLKVKDPQKVIALVYAGVGTGKGFGFGLLSLAPAE